METLAKLFGSETKVKIMRLFLSNTDYTFSTKEVAERVKEDASKVRREMSNLQKMGLVKHRALTKKGSHGHGFIFNPGFEYMAPLQNFFISIELLNPREIIKKINKLGNIKLIIVAGAFIQDEESRADLLIVGDNVKKATLEHTIKTIESEVGKELRYAYFTTDDFKYRLSMFDKLTRDILDYPHKKVLNRLGIV